jgi:hypothetical protein
MAVLVTQVVVCSESDPNVTYLVQLPYCPCKDFRYRRSNPEKYPDSPFCKHIREAMRRVAGWHRQAPAAETAPVSEVATYPRLTRADALTLLTSAYLSSALADELLGTAWEVAGPAVSEKITNGVVLVKYDSGEERYTVTLPVSQPVFLPANWRGSEPEVPTPGMNRATAYEALASAGVGSTEARRALREAASLGRAYAGLPGSGSIPVKHEGSTKDGLFSIELPA